MKKLFLSLLFVFSVHAAEPLKIIVPYAAGGNTDLAARIYAKELANQNIEATVINKPGAEGFIGTQELLSAKPDGSTLLYAGQSAIVYTSVTNPAAYDAMTKIVPVVKGAMNGQMIVSRRDSDIKTIEQLKTALKTRTVAIGNSSSITRSAIEELLPPHPNLIMVNYNGDNAAMAGILNKSVEVATLTFLMETRITSGELNGLAVMTTKGRNGIKSLVELGYNIYRENWTGFIAPPGTPRDVRDRLYNIISKAQQGQELRSQIINVVHADMPRPQTPDEFAKDIESDYRTALKQAGK